jgi:hypothetical protein
MRTDPDRDCADIKTSKQHPKNSVADPGCLFWIPNPKTAAKERSDKNFVVISFSVAKNIYKI